jgi:hypothetical protein
MKSKLLKEINERKDKLNEDIHNLSQQKSKFELDLDKLNSDIIKIKAEIMEQNSQIDYLEQEINTRKATVGFLDNKIKEKETLIDKLQIDIDSNISIFENLKEELSAPKEELVKKIELEFEDGSKELVSEYELKRSEFIEEFKSDNLKKLSYKYPISIASIMELAEIAKGEILEWVEKKRIPGKIYRELAKPNQPLPKSLYINQKTGEGWAQMHFRGITPETYKKVESKEISLWDALLGKSVHIDLRVNYPSLEKSVQYVITESNIQNMHDTMTKSKRSTIGGVEMDKLENLSIDEEGVKLAEQLTLQEDSYWIEPGKIGATPNTYAYMALIWMGSVTTGCERNDSHEIFMTRTKGNEGLFEGKFTIKCLQDTTRAKKWEIWKEALNSIPQDPILHSDIGYSYLVPSESISNIGREFYREESQKLYRSKLK